MRDERDDDGIAFVRLASVDPRDLMRLLNEPRNRRHMPLADRMTLAEVERWARDKDAQWGQNGYGPWAVLVDGTFAGWGGFQREGDDADYALVLLPSFWGSGEAITRQALRLGFEELGFASVTVLLPDSRRADAALARIGFAPVGRTELDGIPFARFRLTRERFSDVDVVSALRSPREGAD